MSITVIFSQMAVLFLALIVGYVANKLKVLNGESNKLLSKLVLNISMPCTILASVMGGSVQLTGREVLIFSLMVILTYLIAFLLALPLPWMLRIPKSDAGLCRFMVVFGNVSFMGFPIVQSIFGTTSAFYVALFNIAFYLLVFSAGILMVSGKNGKIDPKLFVNPSIISAILTILIFAFKIQTPVVIYNTVELLGRITTPAAMLVIGSTLAAVPFNEVFTNWRLYPITAFKLIVVPIITWFILKLFITDRLMLGVLLALAAMPTATVTTMLSMEYGGNEKMASKGVFITTLFSVITLPLVVCLLMR